jgi:hypothetical protein
VYDRRLKVKPGSFSLSFLKTAPEIPNLFFFERMVLRQIVEVSGKMVEEVFDIRFWIPRVGSNRPRQGVDPKNRVASSIICSTDWFLGR